MHDFRLVADDEVRLPAIAGQQAFQLGPWNTGEDGGVGDLVAVQVQNGQHHAIADGVEKFVGMPGRGQWPRFRLAVPDHTGGDEIRVVEYGAEGMGERIAQLAALVDRSGHIGGAMTWNAAGKRELLEQALHATGVARDRRIEFAVTALEPGVGHQRRSPVAGADQGNHVQIALDDDPVQVRVDEVEARGSTPMSQKPGLHVLERQGLGEQRIIEQINLSDTEVIGRAPPCVYALQLHVRQRTLTGFQLAHWAAGLSRHGEFLGFDGERGDRSRNHSDAESLVKTSILETDMLVVLYVCAFCTA